MARKAPTGLLSGNRGAHTKVNIDLHGIKNLQKKVSKRINFLGGDGIRKVLSTLGKELVKDLNKQVEGFKPGRLKDLTPKYKEAKQKKHGRIYPIMRASGFMIDSMYSRVVRGTLRRAIWTIRVGFKGRHPDAKMPTWKLAEIHVKGKGANPVRDFLRPKKRMAKRAATLIRQGLRRIR